MGLNITLIFTPDDLAWMRANAVRVPEYWTGHAFAPATGDLVELSGHLLAVTARIWEPGPNGPMLALYLGNRQPRADVLLH